MTEYKSIITTINNEESPIIEKNNKLAVNINEQAANLNDHLPSVLSENRLNHWVEQNAPQGRMVSYATKLNNNEYTLVSLKHHLLSLSFADFYKNISSITVQVLKLLLYVEQGKEWYFPINPLNIIYNSESGNENCTAFFREPKMLGNIGDNTWMDQILKLIVFLYIPDVDNSLQAFTSPQFDYSKLYTQFLYSAQNQSDELLSLINTYGQENIVTLATQVYDILKSSHSSVEDLLRTLSAGDVINEVNADQEEYANMNDSIPVNNQADAINFGNQQSQSTQPDLNNMSPKERKRYLKQQKEAEKRRQLEARKMQKMQNSQNQQSSKPAKKNHVMLYALLAALLGFGGGYLMQQHKISQIKSEAQQTANKSSDSSSPKNNSNFYQGILYSAASSNEKAVNDINKYFNNGGSQSSLSQSEIQAVFATYLKNNDYNDILKNIGSKATANALITYLIKQNDTNAIKSLNNSGDYAIVSFAKADLNHNYNKMVSLANDVDLSDNQQFQKDLCEAFVKTNQLSQGKQWANSQSNSSELINAMKTFAYQQPNANKQQINQQLGL